MPAFEIEIYRGSDDGSLYHDKLLVEADTIHEAEEWCWANHPFPEGSYPACSPAGEYGPNYYDVEPLGPSIQ